MRSARWRVARSAGLVALLAAVTAAGCGAVGAGQSPARVELRIAAAASLRTAVSGLTAAYTAANPRVAFVVATDSSAALRTQVEQGAPIDVFLSADTQNPRALADAGLAADNPVPFAANAVALAVPKDNPARITGPADLARPGVRVIAAGSNVPITGYAEQVIRRLAELPGYPADYAAAVRANVVSREDNVAAVLAKVRLGEGDAGFVYATDAAGPEVATVDIPGVANIRAVYEGVVVASSDHRDEAARFLAWLAGPAGQAVLRPLGFLAP